MKGYLLDTDIVVFFLRNKKGIGKRLSKIDPKDIYVSEVTIAELEYGNRCSGHYDENRELMDRFLSMVSIVPFSVSIRKYAAERYRLRCNGTPVADFDLLIGCAAIEKGLVMITNNIAHFSRIEGITIENWVESR